MDQQGIDREMDPLRGAEDDREVNTEELDAGEFSTYTHSQRESISSADVLLSMRSTCG